jgi:hypothetical protein
VQTLAQIKENIVQLQKMDPDNHQLQGCQRFPNLRDEGESYENQAGVLVARFIYNCEVQHRP